MYIHIHTHRHECIDSYAHTNVHVWSCTGNNYCSYSCSLQCGLALWCLSLRHSLQDVFNLPKSFGRTGSQIFPTPQQFPLYIIVDLRLIQIAVLHIIVHKICLDNFTSYIFKQAYVFYR